MATKNKSQRKQTTPTASPWYAWLLVVLTLVVYGKTLNYTFVLDDDLFVKNNPVVQRGVSGISDAFSHPSLEHFKGSNFQMYRPALIVAFCIQRTFFGFNPSLFHLVNLLLYAAVCIILFRLLRKLLPTVPPLLAWSAAAIYLVHPIHTEVVANVKGQDELWATLGALLSLRYFLEYLERPERKVLLYYSLSAYLLALFSKESSVAFFAVFPMTLFLLRRSSPIHAFRRSLPWLGAAVLFLISRQAVLYGVRQDYETTLIENSLYGADTFAVRSASVLSILWNNWSLLVWPHPLSWDYSYNQLPLTNWSSALVWVSLMFYLLAIVVSVFLIRRQPLVSWGLLLFLVLLLPTSNIFFLNGTTYAERFLFLPSAGIVIALFAWLSGRKGFTQQARARVPVFAVLVIGVVASAARCEDWKDNLSLFESGVENAPNSSRTQMALATEYMNRAEKSAVMQERQAFIVKSKEGFRRCLEIFPENAVAAYKLGLIEAITGDTSSAIRLYRRALLYKPDDVFSLVNISTIYSVRNQLDSALFFLQKSYAADSLNEMTLANLMVVHFNRGEDAEVVRIGEAAVRNNRSTQKMNDLLARSRSRMATGR